MLFVLTVEDVTEPIGEFLCTPCGRRSAGTDQRITTQESTPCFSLRMAARVPQ